MESIDKLIEHARRVRENSFSPYSGFAVGVALEAADGSIFAGCNVESASYGMTVCAERNAIFTAVAAGGREFTRLAIVADTETLTPPCGACRQIIWEFCGDIPVILADLTGRPEPVRLGELYPQPFDANVLK